MAGRSRNSLALIPTTAVAFKLVLALSFVTTRTTAAPYILVANVISHFVMPEGGSALLPQPQANVQCSVPPGVKCRSLIQNNRLIINVYQDENGGGSAQSFEATHEDDSFVSTFRWSSSKPDRMSRKSIEDTKHLQEAEQRTTWNVNVFEPNDTQEEIFEQTFHTDNVTDGLQGDIYDSSNTDDTTPARNRNTDRPAEGVIKHISEYDEEHSDELGYNKESQIPLSDINEFSNENTLDNSKRFLGVSSSRKTKESTSLSGNIQFKINEDEHSCQDFEQSNEEKEYMKK